MLFRRRALFLAGLFVAVSCSDAGNPMDPEGPEGPQPGPTPNSVLQELTCTLDTRVGDLVCDPATPRMGDALGAISTGNANYVRVKSSNKITTADSTTIDVVVINQIPQTLGTLDGVNPHPTGVRVWVNPPVVVDSTIPGQPASAVVGNADGTLTHSTYTNRPYFQYPGMLEPADTSISRHWRFDTQNADRFTFTVFVLAEVQFPKGWLDIVPVVPVLQVAGVDTLTAQVRGAFGQRVLEGVNWSSSNPAVATVTELVPVDSLAEIMGVGEGTAWIRAVSAVDGINRRDSVLVTVNNAPSVQLDSIDAPARVQVRISSERLRNGLAEGDSVVPNQVHNTARGIATVDSERGLTYVSKGSFVGTDTVPINVTDGEWTVADTLLVKVAPTNYWFVQPGGTGEGANTRPLGSISAAADSAGAGDTIFVLRNGATELVGAAELNAGQALIGHGVPGTFFLREEALNEPGRVDTIFQGQSLGTPLMNTGAPTLRVASGNLVRGVNISSASAAAIHGVGFGTLTVGDVIVQAGGPSLSLVNGNLAGSFLALHSLNSDSAGISLSNVGGAATATAASISGPAGTAFFVSGGSVGLGFPGNITQATSNPLVSVTNHTGTLTLGGVLTASNGTGLQFSNADGTYDLGTVNLTNSVGGADAGVDVTNGSAGTFTFGAGSSITNPAGSVFRIEGSAPSLTYPGGFSKSGAGVGVLIQNNTGGSITFSGSTKTLSTGASHAVAILTDAASVSFSGGNLQLTTAGGRGFYAQDAGTVTVTGGGNTISTTGAPALHLQNATSGASGIGFQSISGSGAANAIVINALTGPGVQVTGTGSAGSGGTLSATSTAVVISSADSTRLRRVVVNAPVAFNASSFGGLRVDSSSVTSTAGAALGLTSGRLYVSDVAVSSSNGAGLSANGVALSGALSSLSTTTTAGNAVSLVNATGTLTASAGTIAASGAAGTAVLVNGSTTVNFTYSGNVTQDGTAPLLDVTGGHLGTLAFNTGILTANGGTGLQFTNADGTYNFTGTLDLSGGDAGIDIGSLSAGAVTVNPAGGHSAAIVSPSGTAIAVTGGTADLTYNGNVTQASNASLLLVNGGHSGDLAFPVGTLSATNGNGLQFDNADGTYDFDGTVTLAGGDAGIDITNGSAGTFTFPTTASITSPNVGNLISILNSAPNFTYSGAFTKANNNVTGILVSNNTGGSITFNGSGVTKSISSGTAAAVSLVSNGSASIFFSGGGLSLTSGAGAGFTATGSGTVQMTGANNTVSSTGGGTAVNIQNVTIGASGVSLLSVNASGGGGGIVLQNTGSNGLQVTGTSTHGSGGTVVNSSGADGAIAGNGVYLENASNVNLSWMNFSGHANHAVRGIGVSNVTLTRLRITGTNGSNAGFDEGAIVFTNLTGSASITSSYIEGGFEDNVRVANTTGTLNRLTMTSDTIGHNGASGNDGVLLDASSSATMNVTVQNSRFTGSRSNNVHYVLNNSAAGDFVFNNNVLTNNHPNKLGSDFGINVGSTSNGAMTYTISGNSVRDAGGSGIEVSHLAGGSGPMTGSITGNTVGVAGVANSGSTAGSGIVSAIVGAGTTATHTTTITGNTVRQYTNYGIRLINRGTGNGYLNATVKTNNIAEPSPNAVASFPAYSGIRAELGASSGPPADDGRTCLDISGNTLNQTGSSTAADLRVFARFGTRTSLLGLGQNGASSVPNTFLQNQNTITVAPGGFGAVNATSTNPFQSSCPPI